MLKQISVKNFVYLIAAVFVLKLVTLCLYPLHHPSEARYTAIAMRMALTGNYLMPFFSPDIPFFGKPPLAFWASAISFEIFGFSEFAGRLPHFLALLLTCFILYRSIKKTFDEKTAIISVAILTSSILFYALHSVMTEGFLLLGMTMITTSFLPTMRGEQKDSLIFFLGCVIAMLAKGPVGIVMPCLAIPIYLSIAHEWKNFFKNFPFICGTIFFLAATLPWFLLAEKSYPGFLQYFFIGENFGRFAKSGWEGDRYGNAHHVPYGMIWSYFIVAILPILFALFLRPKQVAHAFTQEIKQDKTFLFFAISTLAPLLLLTFMRNMIPTYAIYSLTPFCVIAAKILTKIKWEKFAYILSAVTVALYALIIATFLLKPESLFQRLNYQDFLISKIPEKDFKLYYLGDRVAIFTLYWETHDQLEIVTPKNFAKILDRHAYVIGDKNIFDQVLPEQKAQLKLIFCTKKPNTCLYEI